MSRLEFTTEPLDGIDGGVMVRLDGNIDATSALEFNGKVEAMMTEGTTNFLFDMERVLFVNSTGMGMLVKLADRCKQDGGAFLLMKIHPKVKIVFEMLGLNQFFETFSNPERAIASLKGEEEGAAAASPPASNGASAGTAASARSASPPAPAAPAPRRAASMPPPPAAPAARSGAGRMPVPPQPAVPGRRPSGKLPVAAAAPTPAPPPPTMPAPGGTGGSMMSMANLPRDQIGAGSASYSVFIAMPGALPHRHIIYNNVEASCKGAELDIRAMNPDPNAHPRNMADIANAAFVICDFTPINGAVDEQVVTYANTARQMNPPKQVVCVVQGKKDNLPEAFRGLPTVPYHASQQGMTYLQQYLTRGLQQLVARKRQQG